MINEIEDYLQQENYHVNAADICVVAACNCINVQLIIVQQHFVETISTISHPPGKLFVTYCCSYYICPNLFRPINILLIFFVFLFNMQIVIEAFKL